MLPRCQGRLQPLTPSGASPVPSLYLGPCGTLQRCPKPSVESHLSTQGGIAQRTCGLTLLPDALPAPLGHFHTRGWATPAILCSPRSPNNTKPPKYQQQNCSTQRCTRRTRRQRYNTATSYNCRIERPGRDLRRGLENLRRSRRRRCRADNALYHKRDGRLEHRNI